MRTHEHQMALSPRSVCPSQDDVNVMTSGMDIKVLNNVEVSTNAFILRSVENSLSAFSEGDAAVGIDKLWINADGKIVDYPPARRP